MTAPGSAGTSAVSTPLSTGGPSVAFLAEPFEPDFAVAAGALLAAALAGAFLAGDLTGASTSELTSELTSEFSTAFRAAFFVVVLPAAALPEADLSAGADI